MRRLLPLFAFALLLGCNSDAAKPGGAPAPAAPDRKAEQPAAPKPAAGDAATFTIQGNDQMQYDVKQIDVKPGQKVRITMKNAGNLPKLAMGHNLVVLRKGVTLEQFKPLSEKDGTIDNDYLPPDSRQHVLAHTKILGPGESETIEFTAPGLPGELVYLCTFPAHATVMNGKIVVK